MEFTLKHPLAGFENINCVKLSQIDEYFYSLHSSDDTISFSLVDPFKLTKYDFEIPTNYKILLDANEKSKLLTLNIMIVSTPPENSVINFVAPFIFNLDNNFCVQVLLDTNKYPHFSLTEPISKFLDK